MACVVNVRKAYLQPKYEDLVDWLQDKSHIYIGRDMSFYVGGAYKSKWANPFKVKKVGAKSNKVKNQCQTLEESLRLYEEYIRNTPELMAALPELQNKTLGCWCKPASCHGDILIKLLKELDDTS